jgi:hypothetical protein
MNYIIIEKTYELGVVINERTITSRFDEEAAIEVANVWAYEKKNKNVSYSVFKVADDGKHTFVCEVFST